MKTGEHEEDNGHRSNIRKILEDFRKSLKDEFSDFLEKSEEQQLSETGIPDNKPVAKTDKPSYHDENRHDLRKRENRKHAQSVLLDPRVISEMRSVQKDGIYTDTIPKMAIVDLKDESSVLNSEAMKTDNMAKEIMAPLKSNELLNKGSIASTPIEVPLHNKDIQKHTSPVQNIPDEQVKDWSSNGNHSLSKCVPLKDERRVLEDKLEDNETSEKVSQRDNKEKTQRDNKEITQRDDNEIKQPNKKQITQCDNSDNDNNAIVIAVGSLSHKPQQFLGAPSYNKDAVHEVNPVDCETSQNDEMHRQIGNTEQTVPLEQNNRPPVIEPAHEDRTTLTATSDSEIVKPTRTGDVDISTTVKSDRQSTRSKENIDSLDLQIAQSLRTEVKLKSSENADTTVIPNSPDIHRDNPTDATVTPNSPDTPRYKPTDRTTTDTIVTPNSPDTPRYKPTDGTTTDTTVTPISPDTHDVKQTNWNIADRTILFHDIPKDVRSPVERMHTNVALVPRLSLQYYIKNIDNESEDDESISCKSNQNSPPDLQLLDVDSTNRIDLRNSELKKPSRTLQSLGSISSSDSDDELDNPQHADKQTQCELVYVTKITFVDTNEQSSVRDAVKLKQLYSCRNIVHRDIHTCYQPDDSSMLISSDIAATSCSTDVQPTSRSYRRQSVGGDNGGYVFYGKKCEAQAQANAEQRKNSDVHLKFGNDGLHIQTDSDSVSKPDQRMLMPPQQLHLPPSSHHGTPLYDNYDGRVAMGGLENTHQNSYSTNVTDFAGSQGSAYVHREPPDGHVFDSYSGSNDNNNIITVGDNILGHYNSPRDNRNAGLYDDPTQADLNNRRRRLGRDHTNYVLPSNLAIFKDKKIKYENNQGGVGIDDGPPGLLLSGNDNNYGDENGLKLVVVDETDDEDGNVNLAGYQNDGNSQLFHEGYTPRSNSDVFPIDKKAIDRDLYKQVYDPSAETVKPNRSPSLQIHNGLPMLANPESVNNTRDIPLGKHQLEYRNKNDDASRPGFVYHVTDYDSETATETGRNSLVENQTFNTRRKISSVSGSASNNEQSYDRLPSVYGHHHHEKVRGAPTNNSPQQLYSVSQMEYDRYTSNTSQLSSGKEDNPHGKYNNVKSRTFVIPQSSVNSSHVIKDTKHQDAKIPGPGYKFQVNKYNVAKRASILNRAEQLIDARRGQFTDRSDSSDELERIDEDDNEDSDLVDDMSGPRHRALKHLQRRVYDDSTSYNSSDDVLHNMRYHPRGPVSQAARRARLTSVNARLKKQKRMRASRRQILPPPPLTSDDESSSGSDSTDRPMSKRQPHEGNRYEESNLPDLNGEGNRESQQYTHQGDASPGPKGRRALFFRNGDIHYKPRQVLINNKTYTNLEKLLVDLSSMVETSTGVKYIFSWPEGREIKSITEFENGKYYVCSSTNRLQRVDYGNSKENHWKVGKIDRNENFLFQQAAKVHSPLRRPRVLTVISNLCRDSREKLILNTNSQMNFEDIFTDISNMINIPNPPVKALYTDRKPHQKVESYSQLIRDFADHDNFLACGEEMVPVELSSRRPDHHPEAAAGYRLRRGSKKTGTSGTGRFQDESVSSPRSPDGAHDLVNTRELGKIRRRRQDSVRVDINGKVREFFPPTQLIENDDGLKPDKMLRLNWVYGYRGRDVKQNLAVIPSSGELVYFVAAVVIVYNKKLSSQRHYLGHSEEITCLAVHPNGRFIATGQVSGKTPETGAHVRIWDSVSLSTYAVIGLGVVQQGVACVSFSEKELRGVGGVESTYGDLVMAIDDSDRHTLTIWEWQTEKLVARTSTTSEPVVSGCFYPFDENLLVTYGKEHVHFWKMFWDKGGKIMRDKLSGHFEGNLPKFVTSVCFSPNGDVVTGDTSGAILVWTRDSNNVFAINRTISAQTRKAHKKSVSALCMLGDGTLLSGGGNIVKAWDTINNYALVKERVLPETVGHVRTIVPMNRNGLDGSIYVATTRNKVLEGSLQLKFKVIIQGHVEELWAVESHPFEETFVSAGHDQSVVKWSAVSHKCVWNVNVENPCTSISIDPKGRLIALGTTAGKVVILNSSSGVHLTTLMSGTVQINALSFSPDGSNLAVGTFDGYIQIFQIQDEGHNFYRPQTSALKYNNMFIMHLDWSLDSRTIQAVMGDYEIVYWNITTMQRIKSSRSVRDVKWATHNCPIGHAIIGPWQNLDRGDVINVVSRSQNRDMQVVGDTNGRLRLYKWPCSTSKPGYRQTKVYSSNVTCASFTCHDSYLITSGGNDAALMQFSVLNTVNPR